MLLRNEGKCAECGPLHVPIFLGILPARYLSTQRPSQSLLLIIFVDITWRLRLRRVRRLRRFLSFVFFPIFHRRRERRIGRRANERTELCLCPSVRRRRFFLRPSVGRPLRIGQMTAAPWLHTYTHTRSTAAATRRRAQKISPPDVDKLPQTMQPKPEREENCAIGLITAPSEAARPLWTSQGRPRGASDAFPAKCCAETSVFQSSQRANINFRQSLSRGAMT